MLLLAWRSTVLYVSVYSGIVLCVNRIYHLVVHKLVVRLTKYFNSFKRRDPLQRHSIVQCYWPVKADELKAKHATERNNYQVSEVKDHRCHDWMRQARHYTGRPFPKTRINCRPQPVSR